MLQLKGEIFRRYGQPLTYPAQRKRIRQENLVARIGTSILEYIIILSSSQSIISSGALQSTRETDFHHPT